MDRLNPNNNNISKRGKTIRTVIHELSSFSNPNIYVKTLIERDEKEEKPANFISQIAFEKEYCLLINEEDNNKKITVKELLRVLLNSQNLDIEICFMSNNQINSIGLLGKMEDACVLFASENRDNI